MDNNKNGHRGEDVPSCDQCSVESVTGWAEETKAMRGGGGWREGGGSDGFMGRTLVLSRQGEEWTCGVEGGSGETQKVF